MAGERNWLGIVSRDHVLSGVEKGMAQIGHGKSTGLRRMRAGDGFVYYSPRDAMEVPIADLRDRLALTAKPNWGYALRRGLIELSAEDFALIHAAMTEH
jgi:hypothetical protein